MNPYKELRPGPNLPRVIARLLALLLLILVGTPGLAGPQGPYNPPLATIGNPSPGFWEYFGWTLAPVGNDRILVGVHQDNTSASLSGAAYLFDTNGALLSSFANPTPASGDNFGYSVSGFGNDRVLIGARRDNAGASDSGAAYLFRTDGGLLTTFTNPTARPNAFFGCAVAPVGNDKVLVGAFGDSTGASSAGAAYLLSTNGGLLASFYNPAPSALASFGMAVAGVGNDLVLIGAHKDDTGGQDSGVAYLFDTAGGLLTTFTNPSPVGFGNFGWSVAGLGNDRVLIGAEGNQGAGVRAGAVYLFTTGGTLLTTFTNPSPAQGDLFGHSVAAVGNDRVLVGAGLDDTDGPESGAAYLFDTNGVLLATFRNPTPEGGDQFGYSVGAMGADRVLIGAWGDNTGDTHSGAAYVFGIPNPPPPLSIAVGPSTVSIRWVTPEPGLILQQAGLLDSSAVWTDSAEPVTVTGPTNLVQQPLGTTNRYYRLRLP